MHVAVSLPLPLPRPFTYGVPDALKARAQQGCRVLVPFGSRRLTGVIVDDRADAVDVRQIKAILDVLDDVPSFTEELLDLVKWMAEYYVCSSGEVIRAMLPPGASGGRGEMAAKIEKHIRFAGSYRHERAIDELRDLVPGAKQLAVLECLAGFCSEGDPEPRQADLLDRASASHSTIQSLMRRGIIDIVEREVLRTPFEQGGAPQPADIALHPAQIAALEKINAAVDEGSFHTFLLHGVTGSGKTQVYIEALKSVLEKGKTGIVLVPEIALTPQTVRRFRAHFGDRIAVFHSRMSQGERFDAWRALRSGRFDVVIGPRSALLVPLTNVGLVIVDEEHDASYKQQDPAPRYHARDVAVMRASMNDAVCVLGSATPSLESYLNVQTGKYALLPMPERVPLPDGETATLPKVRIVDLRVERNQNRLSGAFSTSLLDAIGERIRKEEQVILLQNRRGYAPMVQCRACGWAPECPDCSVTMTLHKSRLQLRCHYCGRTARIPKKCPGCAREDLDTMGTGTQRVEEELEEHFPDARIIRMDLDTTTAKNAHDQLLRRFGEGKADILLGTQMVAKGLDFGRVTLVGVINADLGMMLPDFRSEERTFQLLAQVSGRAGRSLLSGEVIIQTRNPDRAIIRYARDHEYETFAEAALAERQKLGYPPFGRMAAVEFKGPSEGQVADLARNWTAGLRRCGDGIEVLGPEPAFISRVKKQYRYHTIVKAPRQSLLQGILRRAEEAFGDPPSKCRVNIDIDPVGLF
jgi:primosomal protein N' (replication factor Y)